MKNILTIILALACIALGVVLFLNKQSTTAQHETDAAALTDCSNTLAAAQSQLTTSRATLTTLSNSFDASQTAALTASNQLAAAQASIDLTAGQLTTLTQQVAQLNTANEALGRSTMELTNSLNSQVTVLADKTARAEASLADVQHDHVLLEERLRRDVAERLILQRQFYNPDALQAQLAKLKDAGGSFDVTADKIYAGLDLEVRSNGSIHAISPQ